MRRFEENRNVFAKGLDRHLTEQPAGQISAHATEKHLTLMYSMPHQLSESNATYYVRDARCRQGHQRPRPRTISSRCTGLTTSFSETNSSWCCLLPNEKLPLPLRAELTGLLLHVLCRHNRRSLRKKYAGAVR